MPRPLWAPVGTRAGPLPISSWARGPGGPAWPLGSTELDCSPSARRQRWVWRRPRGREDWARASRPALRLVAHLGVSRAEGWAKPQGRAPGLGFHRNHRGLRAALLDTTPSKRHAQTAAQTSELERHMGPVSAQKQCPQPPTATNPARGRAEGRPALRAAHIMTWRPDLQG